MKAVVLVGGFGTRLRPLTAHTPKQMLPVVGTTMIERVVEGLGSCGVTDAVLSLGYRPDAFLEAYPDDVCAGVRLHYAIEPEPLDTAGAVRFAASDAGIESTFLVVNGDVLTDLDIAALWDFHSANGGSASIALTPVEDPSRYGVVPIDANGRVEAFIEKPLAADAPSKWINAGTYVMEPSVLELIPAGRKVSIERETFPLLVADQSLYALQSDAYWIDAGTPEAYLQCQLDVIDSRRGFDEPAVAASATVLDGATVRHSVVLDGATIAASARVEDSLIMAGATVGEGAQVNRSIIGPQAVVGAGAMVSDLTVVGGGEQVDAGSTLSSARIPQEAGSHRRIE